MPGVRFASHAGLLLVACAVLGCGAASTRKAVYPVTGKVLFQSNPVKGGSLTFHPQEEVENPRATRSLTTVEADGTYTMTTYTTRDGVPAGEYVVTLYWPGKVPPGSPIGEVGPDLLQGKYSNPKTSPLRASVKEEANTINFTLPIASASGK